MSRDNIAADMSDPIAELDRIQKLAKADYLGVGVDQAREFKTTAPRLVQALRDVLALHIPDGSQVIECCEDCRRPWPCPTVQSITEATGGEKCLSQR